jgi:dTDP-4-amino-4,6-dideoxygalactose transaminase
MKIPVFDLKRQMRQIRPEIDKSIKEVLDSGSYILGKNVSAFEQEFAQYCGAGYAMGAASGTDALKIALEACGIKKGDEVITTPFTFLATSEAIYSIGAKIVFADIDLVSYNIDPREIEKKITGKTRAVICVHLYGQPCNMDAITSLARKYNLKLIEDCAQAAGAEYKGKKAGTFGDAGCFSFYPTKNLGAYGDGGIIITDNKQIEAAVRVLSLHGSKSKYEHVIHGYNSRLDELQAAILRTKLKYLDKWNEGRRENAAYYNKKLSALEEGELIVLPKEQKNTKHVCHLYVLRVKKRDALMKSLKLRGIGTSFHYPIPLHLQEVYKESGYCYGDFPFAELAAKEVVSLPLYPELNKKEIDYITDAVSRVIS